MRRIIAHIFLIATLILPPIPISADKDSVLPPETKAGEEEVSENVSESSRDQSDPDETDSKPHETEDPKGDATDPKRDGTGNEGTSEEVMNTPETRIPKPDTPSTDTDSGSEASPTETETTSEGQSVPADSGDTNDAASMVKPDSEERSKTRALESVHNSSESDDQKLEKESDVIEKAPEIIISEIQIAGKTANDEFIELYNPESEDINLEGLRLCRKTSGTSTPQIKVFSDDDIVPGNKFFLIAYSNSDFAGFADIITKSTRLAPNNALAIVSGSACDDTDTIILDSVVWGSGTAFSDDTPRTENPPPDHSLVRDPETGDWSLSDTPSPVNSEGKTGEEPEPEPDPEPNPDLPPPGTIILNEIFPNPVDESDEWVELFNTSQETIPLAGWILADAVKEYVMPDGMAIEAGDLLIIPKSESGLALNNGDETVTLIMPNGAVSDSFEYTKTVEESSWARDETGNFELTDVLTPGETNLFPVVEEPYLAPLPPDGSIRINEVFANPETRGEADEWIELANTSSADISLAGFILRDASKYGKYVLGDAVALGAGRFLVLPRSETGISLNNSVETLRLLWSDDETTITSLTYDRTVEGASYGYYKDDRYRFSEKDTPGKKNRFGKEPKIENSDIPKRGYRDVPVAFSAEGSEDDMRYVWDFGDEHRSYKQETTHRYEKTGKYHGSLTVRGDIEEVVKTFTIRIEKYPKHDLRITALLPNPDGRDTDFEWIRIENREKKTVGLTGWIIATGTTEEKLVNHKILTEGLKLGGGESITLTREDSRFTLPNKSAVIELRRPDGSRADRITYDRPDGIDEEELLMVADDGSLVWIAPTPEADTSTAPASHPSEEPGDPFLRGMTEHPSPFTFASFLALGTPFRLTLPDTAPRVLGLSDTRFDTKPEKTKRDLSFLDSLFQSLNTLLTHRLR